MKNRTKNIIAVLLILVVSTTAIACTANKDKSDSSKKESASSETMVAKRYECKDIPVKMAHDTIITYDTADSFRIVTGGFSNIGGIEKEKYVGKEGQYEIDLGLPEGYFCAKRPLINDGEKPVVGMTVIYSRNGTIDKIVYPVDNTALQYYDKDKALELFAKNYYLNLESDRSAYPEGDLNVPSKISVGNENYIILEYLGEGANMGLYKVSSKDGIFKMESSAGGEFSRSAGISFNIAKDTNGKYVCFGNINETHLDGKAAKNARPFPATKIVFKSGGKDVSVDVLGKKGYIAMLPGKIDDFHIYDAKNKELLNMKDYKEQGWTIRDRKFSK